MSRTLRVLIVDDEPLARRRIRDLLATVPEVEVVREVGSADAAIGVIGTHHESGDPLDIVFLDVEMPGGSGLNVVTEIGPEAMPQTIFVTAYDRYAITAFDVDASDYLLKPYDDERFFQALSRAKRAALLRDTPSGLSPSPATGYAERIAVEQRGGTVFVPVGEIEYVTSSGPYAELHTSDAVHVIRQTMRALDDLLDPTRFTRIHRSTIVRLGAVEALLTAPGGSYAVRLHNGESLSVSRSRREALVERLSGRAG
ncbi:MAG: LytTR family DNA-binding domain-containing protein [Bacteroidota bacterium]